MADRYRIIFSERVAVDLETIFERINADSPENAPKFMVRILDAFESLKIFPHRNVVGGGRARIKHPVRSLPIKPYVVFFRVIDAERVVRIIQVRHGARQRPKRFRRK